MQARAAAAAFEAAFAMTVPPPVIAANRVSLLTLIATNFFGQNTSAIMATEAQYGEMWAQDAAAMYGYAAASAAATVLKPYQSPPSTSTPEGVVNQGFAVAQAAAEPVGDSGQNAAAVSQLLPLATPNALQQLATPAATSTTPGPFTWLTNTIRDFLTYGLPTPTNNWLGLASPQYTAILKQTLTGYFEAGIANFSLSIGQQLTFGTGATAGAGGAWYPTPQFAGLHLGSISGVSAVSGDGGGSVLASAGSSGKVGMLSVPANWAEPTSEATLVSAVAEETPVQPGAMTPGGAPGAGSNAVLRGIPTGMVGRRTAGYGYTNKYGFKHSVLTRPPSAG